MELLRMLNEKFPHEEFSVSPDGLRLFVNGEDTKVDWQTSIESYKSLSAEEYDEWVYMNCELMDSFLEQRRK